MTQNDVAALTADLDIDAFQSVQSGVLVLRDPITGAPTKSTILLAGKEHENRRRIDMARQRKMRATLVKTGKIPNVDPLEELEEETDYLVAATLGWNIMQGGQPLPFSSQAARELYTDPRRQWLRDQVSEGVKSQELFISASAKT